MGRVSAAQRSCETIIKGYVSTGLTREEAITEAINHVSHDVVFFMRSGNRQLQKAAQAKLDWLNNEKRRMTDQEQQRSTS